MALEFSVVIPTHGRPASLTACLEALAKSDFPRERFEVIVVDDGSVPPVPIYRGPLDVRLIRQENAGPAEARNAGAALARGRYLAFTDDDCAPATDWLSRLADELRREPGAMVGGRTVNGLPGNVFAEASQSLLGFLYSYYNAVEGRAQFLASNNVALPADRFRSMGGFDNRFRRPAGEDRWLCKQWSRRGWPMRYVPTAVVIHSHHMAFRGFWRQHFTYGRAAYEFHRKAAGPQVKRPKLEPMTFYADLLRTPWRDREAHPLRQSVLLLVTQAANAAGFFYECARGREHQPWDA